MIAFRKYDSFSFLLATSINESKDKLKEDLSYVRATSCVSMSFLMPFVNFLQ